MTTAIIVGGGMAGVACASELADHDVNVTLIDRNNYTQFQPLLYQVASSQLPAEDVARPLATAFAGQDRVAVVTAEITGIDAATRTVTTPDGPVTADYLVIAAGSQANFFGVPGAAEHAFPLYTVQDARRLRRHLRDRLRVLCDPAGDGAPYTVVICGGGPTGVETAGALAELFGALKEQGTLHGEATVRLVDHGHALLKPFTDKTHEYALAKLTEKGVQVTFGVAVSAVGADTATLSDGTTVATDTVIWAGGISGPAIAATTGIALGHGGRIDVAADLTVPGLTGVYAVGDVANIPDTENGADGHPLPQLGSVALQAGKWAGKNIVAEVRGDGVTPFHYHDKGIMAMIGRNAAVSEIGKHRHHLEGPLAFVAWLGLHAVLLSGIHSQVDAFLNWADDYFHHDRAADLELADKVGRIAWADDEADVPNL
ncbi:NAD(P)/FAD-dependent oxidoreductase [Nakamurella sp.]|uniref:NAD(P)/FAD-dependent oxidoreductase n=1 Tax=Nakamurella sp. TaxID=1869182 RepID=UPI0037838C04